MSLEKFNQIFEGLVEKNFERQGEEIKTLVGRVANVIEIWDDVFELWLFVSERAEKAPFNTPEWRRLYGVMDGVIAALMRIERHMGCDGKMGWTTEK